MSGFPEEEPYVGPAVQGVVDELREWLEDENEDYARANRLILWALTAFEFDPVLRLRHEPGVGRIYEVCRHRDGTRVCWTESWIGIRAALSAIGSLIRRARTPGKGKGIVLQAMALADTMGFLIVPGGTDQEAHLRIVSRSGGELIAAAMALPASNSPFSKRIMVERAYHRACEKMVAIQAEAEMVSSDLPEPPPPGPSVPIDDLMNEHDSEIACDRCGQPVDLGRHREAR